jgi:hypothetical protein
MTANKTASVAFNPPFTFVGFCDNRGLLSTAALTNSRSIHPFFAILNRVSRTSRLSARSSTPLWLRFCSAGV